MRSLTEFGEYILANAPHGEKPSDKVHIIINYPKIEWSEKAEYMATLTWFSGIPLNRGGSKAAHVIFAEDLDEAVKKADQYDYAMVSFIGSFYYSQHDVNIFDYFDEFCASELPCRGHLLFHPTKQYGFLHPQTIFINLKNWREIGKPSFGYYSGPVINYERSTSNVHDDYTPHWVKAGEGYREVENQYQAEYVSKVLEHGGTILNFDKQRGVKFFSYPERDYSEALEFEKNRNSDIIYVKNNSLYPKLDKKFDVIYAPAAGAIGEYLLKHYGNPGAELVIYDNNKNSVAYKKMLYSGMVRKESDLESVAKYFRNKGCIIDDCSYKPSTVKANEELLSTEEYLTMLNGKKPKITEFDVLEDMFDVDPDKSNLIYFSNIFSYNFLIHKMKVEDIHSKFLEYTKLPNTSVCGTNIFKEWVYYEEETRRL
jgi:hypothetical protein